VITGAMALFCCVASCLAGFAAEPIRALLVTGGCCHDYEAQKKILSEGISARANVTWTIVHEGTDRTHYVSIYTNADWAKGFDVVLHNECFGQATNVAFVEGIVLAHSSGGVPAVMLHCSTHSYRYSSSDEWRKLLGVSSYQHGAKHAFEISNLQPSHPVMKGFPEKWQDFPDELYQLKKTWPDCVPLGKAISSKESERNHVGQSLSRSRDARLALGLRQTGRGWKAQGGLREAMKERGLQSASAFKNRQAPE
jgi:hypothetical protein